MTRYLPLPDVHNLACNIPTLVAYFPLPSAQSKAHVLDWIGMLNPPTLVVNSKVSLKEKETKRKRSLRRKTDLCILYSLPMLELYVYS